MPEIPRDKNPVASSQAKDDANNGHGNIEADNPIPGIYLCFDFGSKRIGIATGHTDTAHASPLETIRNINGRPEWEKLDDIIEQWRPVGLVVGLPLSEDGQQQMLLPLSKSFAKKLSKRYGLKTYRCDERFSSIEASRILADSRKFANRRKIEREDTDKVAAAVILDHWFMEQA